MEYSLENVPIANDIVDKKNIWPVFFFFSLLAIVDVEGMKTTLKVGGAEHILSNISEIIEDIVFV